MGRYHGCHVSSLTLLLGVLGRCQEPGPLDASAVFEEFWNPSHTHCVQILEPMQGAWFGSDRLRVTLAAPEGTTVRLDLDGDPILELTERNQWQADVTGLKAGRHTLKAEILGSMAPAARASVSFRTCNCGDWEDGPEGGLHLMGTDLNAQVRHLENPLWPGVPLAHAGVFHRFRPWYGASEDGYIIDWLGVRTRSAWDCFWSSSYFKYQLSRRKECKLQPELAQSGDLEHLGFMPMADDEYFQWVVMLQSVVKSQGRPYVVVELGASFGTWGVRALAAYRQLFPRGSSHFVGIESSVDRVRQMHHHVLANNIANFSLLHGYVTGDTNTPYKNMPYWSSGDFARIYFGDVLELYDHVSYLDIDIQGAEEELFSDQDLLRILTEKVHSAHIGTHSHEIHRLVRSALTSAGWEIEFDLAFSPNLTFCDSQLREPDMLQREQSCLTDTKYGPVYVRDGIIGAVNTRFQHPND
eukprot:3446065-Rhodomonas_salina.2